MPTLATAPESDMDLHTPQALSEPYSLWKQLRDTAGAVWLTRYQMYAISRYDDVRAALLDWETYSSAQGVAMNDEKNAVRGFSLHSDPPEHGLMRRISHRPLRAEALRELEDEFQAEAERLIDSLVERRSFDAVADLARHLPLTVVARYVGLPEKGRQNMLKWAAASFNSSGPIDNELTREALAILKEELDYIASEAIPGKLSPTGWGQSIYDAADRGELPAAKCPIMMLDYINPSLDTTIAGISNAIWLFARYPEQWDILRARRELIPNAVNEVIRLESPIPSFTRVTTTDTQIDGVAIPAGSRVMVMYGSANRDERQWSEPTTFNITRPHVARQLGWGVGEHACLGMGLARLEMRTILAALINRVERIEIEGMERAINMTLRSLKSLQVRVSPIEPS